MAIGLGSNKRTPIYSRTSTKHLKKTEHEVTVPLDIPSVNRQSIEMKVSVTNSISVQCGGGRIFYTAHSLVLGRE